MAVNTKVDIFSTSMRTEFQVAFQATAEPAPFEKFTLRVPSTARIEHYTWMSPSPGMQRYAGHRRYGKIDTVRYSVENLEFDAAFEVLTRDIEDDQTGGYMLKPKELAERAKAFPGRWAIKHLAAGASRLCFDGTNFFNDTHAIGVGDNKLTATGTGPAGTYKMAALYHGGPLKPLIWQDRKGPDFENDSGSTQSKERKIVRYWIDMEGEAAYGYWWDAVLMTWTGLPNIVEFHAGLSDITGAFRSFRLPRALTSDDDEYLFEQVQFSDANLTLVGHTSLERVAAQALGQEFVPVTAPGGAVTAVGATNLYMKYATFIPSAFMN